MASWLQVRTTPERLRLMAIIVTLVIAVTGLAAWLLTDQLVAETDQIADSTGEVLIASQQLSASMAEADSSAVSVHLAGASGDRVQRRLYEQAIERATANLANIARLVGDDPESHTLLREVGAFTAEYTGLVEAGRSGSVAGLDGADAQLRSATALNRTEIAPRVETLIERAQTRFTSDIGVSYYGIAFAVLALALLTLVAAQFWMFRRFRRMVNLPLLIATIVLVLVVVFAGRAALTRQNAFTVAETDAYNSLVTSNEIQQAAYRYRALESEGVLRNVGFVPELADLNDALTAERGLFQRAVSQADSTREQAGAQEVSLRWERYLVESNKVQDALRTTNLDLDLAKAVSGGSANSTFNGFNASVEAALLDNREQFVAQLTEASGSLRWLRAVIGIGSVLAAVLAWWGFAIRIGEYR